MELSAIDWLLLDIDDLDKNEAASNAVLAQIYGGAPVSDVERLLRSQSLAAVEAGAWIASELGHFARPLLPAILDVLHTGSATARFFSIDAILLCADDNGEAVAAAISRINDEDAAVRWKAMRFLVRVGSVRLETSEQFLEEEVQEAVRWLLRLKTNQSEDVLRRLHSERWVDRAFAAVAVVRLKIRTTQGSGVVPMVEDDEIRSFLSDEIQPR